MPRTSLLPALTVHPSSPASRPSVRSTMPRWLPQKPGMTAGTPFSVPRSRSAPGKPA